MNPLLPLLLATTALAAPQDPIAPTRDMRRELDAFTAPFAEAGHLSGTFLVAKGDQVLYEGAWGAADRELGARCAPNTVFCLGSASWRVTRVLAEKMCGDGVLSKTDTIDKWLPEFPRADEITVDHLILMSGGIKNWLVPKDQRARTWTAEQLTELAAGEDLDFEPGSRGSFSAGSYAVLARVLELAGGKSYGELLKEQLFDKAEMTMTRHAGSLELVPGRASYYSFASTGILNAPLEDVTWQTGFGSIWTTPRDMFKFERALLRGDYGDAARAWIDLSVLFRWDGLIGVYRTYVDYFPDLDATMIWTGNIRTGAVERLRFAAQALLKGEEIPQALPPRMRPVVLDPEVVAKYCGNYQTPGEVKPLQVRDGQLYFDEWVLIPIADATFFSPTDYGMAKVLVDQDGIGRRLDWTLGEVTLPCMRVD